LTLRRVLIGDLEVSERGLGCVGMSSLYGPADWDTSLDTIRRALDLGVTLIDTADIYGSGHNEVLVGRGIAGRREEVQLATKVGWNATTGRVMIRNEPDYIKGSCVQSLQRLGVDVIDLYYLHRVTPAVPIEESVGAMAELVEKGLVRHIGLCEVNGHQLRSAHRVYPITAVQSEYSLWTREPETTVVDTARELGVGLVAYSPLGSGFLTGTLDPRTMRDDDGRRIIPRLTGTAGEANLAVTDVIVSIAQGKGISAAQVALAWVSQQSTRLGITVVPIPGAKRIKWVEENSAGLTVAFTADELAVLDSLADRVVGDRHPKL
jgi:aryl-alcohol dehydrogenase-like predicted oxidoreductase